MSEMPGSGFHFATDLLQTVGLDSTEPEYQRTPERWMKYLATLLCRSFEPMPQMTTFESSADEMIVVDPISFFSLCPHHLALVFGTAYIGYVPAGRVFGLSKIPRLVRWLAGHPIKQEDLTGEIATTLWNTLQCINSHPKGVAVVLRATHTCMTTRGVRVNPDCRVQTSKMLGCYLDPTKQARAEFLALVANHTS